MPYHRQHPRYQAPTVADVNVLYDVVPTPSSSCAGRRVVSLASARRFRLPARCARQHPDPFANCTRSFPPAPEHFPVNCVDEGTARATRGTDMPVLETALIEFYLPMRFWDRGGSGSVGAGGGDRKTRIGYPFAGRDISNAVTAC